MILQFITNGLVTGLLYSLFAIGFSLVYNTTRIFHIAAAALYVIAAYGFYSFANVMSFPISLAFILTVCLTMCSGTGLTGRLWHGERIMHCCFCHCYCWVKIGGIEIPWRKTVSSPLWRNWHRWELRFCWSYWDGFCSGRKIYPKRLCISSGCSMSRYSRLLSLWAWDSGNSCWRNVSFSRLLCSSWNGSAENKRMGWW